VDFPPLTSELPIIHRLRLPLTSNWPLNATDKKAMVLLLCARLAKSLAAPQDAERLEAYAEALDDLGESTLLRVFDRATRELRFFPEVAKLREFAGVLDQQRTDAATDEAWRWVCEYIRRHGVDGHAYLEDSERRGADPNCPTCCGSSWETLEREVERKDGSKYAERRVRRCACFGHGRRVLAPEIPLLIQLTLRTLGSSVVGSLEMIRDTEGRYQSKLRDKFSEAHRRVEFAMVNEVVPKPFDFAPQGCNSAMTGS
jgi:hypothetical protein